MLKRFVNRFIRVLKSTKGYTLVEVAAVVAITGTLAAVAVPVAKNQVGSGKTAAAVQDVQAIAGAINQLRGDTSFYPVYDSASARTTIGTTVDTLGKTTAAIALLASRKGTTPALNTVGVGWATEASTALDEGYLPSTLVGVVSAKTDIASGGTVGAFEDHLVQNGAGYDTKNWNGPYYTADKADPWGHKYLCNIGDLYEWDNNTNVPINAVIVISAGPNGVIETAHNQLLSTFAVRGDDIASRVQ